MNKESGISRKTLPEPASPRRSNQLQIVACCWAILGFALLVITLNKDWERLTSGDTSTWFTMSFCFVILLAGLGLYLQKLLAKILMMGCTLMVMFLTLDWALFFTFKVGSNYSLGGLVFLFFFSLYTPVPVALSFDAKCEGIRDI